MSDKMSRENALTFVGTRLALHTHSLKTSTDTLGLAESIRLNREACAALGEDCLKAYEGTLYILAQGKV